MHILLLEDEDALRKIYTKLLEKSGFEVTALADGWEGFKEGSLNNFDVVVTDYNMPGMTGFECMETLLAMNPALRFIFISGTGDDALIRQLKDHPQVAAFLPKPVKSAVLIETVSAIEL